VLPRYAAIMNCANSESATAIDSLCFMITTSHHAARQPRIARRWTLAADRDMEGSC
jgi:hypothetical protein